MQSKIHKFQVVIYFCSLLFLSIKCNEKTNLEKYISITINSIDKKTKQRRINLFDLVTIRKEEFGLFKKTFKKVGEYVMDSSGSVRIKIDPNKICDISVTGSNVLGGDMFYPGYLKDGQVVNIEVFSINER
jgi:hypothetical protein